MFLALSKAQLFSSTLSVLGSQVHVGCAIRIDPGRVSDLMNMPEPANIKELERTFGAFAYVATHLPRFADVATPLRKTLTVARALDAHHIKGGGRPSRVVFPLAPAARRSFEELKRMVATAEDLAPFDELAADTV